MPPSFLGSTVRDYHIPYLEMSAALQNTLDTKASSIAGRKTCAR